MTIRFLVVGVAVSGLLALAGCTEDIRVIEVNIEHSLFTPTRFDVSAGETVRFVVTNTDPIDHEFLIGDTEAQLAHETGTEAHHGAKPGEISIPAGATRSTTYTFGEPGETLFGCHIPAHYDYGMRGSIEIT